MPAQNAFRRLFWWLLFASIPILFFGPGRATNAQATGTDGKDEHASIDIRIPKGKFFFTAWGTSDASTIRPLDEGHCVEDYTLSITVLSSEFRLLHPDMAVKGNKVWQHWERLVPPHKDHKLGEPYTSYTSLKFREECEDTGQ